MRDRPRRLRPVRRGLPECAPAPRRLRYIDIAAGFDYSLFLRSDGQVLATSENNKDGQLSIPRLPKGLRYTAISNEDHFAVLLRSDGEVVRVGSDGGYRPPIPRLKRGWRYVIASAGWKAFVGGAEKIPPGTTTASSISKLPRNSLSCAGRKAPCPGEYSPGPYWPATTGKSPSPGRVR
ncbi:MAG: hypothetical protein HZY75_12775 [Nocardioidaceae bacterium]|nr:MAG: hypothetical protein HZY75_12775 [Nocardioidaceae bacterium]